MDILQYIRQSQKVIQSQGTAENKILTELIPNRLASESNIF